MTREEAIEIINRENDPNDKKVWELFPEYREALDMAIQALSQEPCDDVEQIDYHDDFATASRKIHDYEERQKQNDKKCGSYNNTNTFKSCSNCKLIGTDSCYMVCGGSKSLYKPKQKIEPCDDAISREAVYSILKEYHIDEEEIESAMDECQNLTVNAITSDVSLLPSVTQKSGK